MTHISCKSGHVPIEKGQEWALEVEDSDGAIQFLILRVEGIELEQVSFEVVRAERSGAECDMVQPLWQDALERFGYNERFYFAHRAWHVWNIMMPNGA